MTTYNIHDLAWSRGVSEPVREAILSLQAESASLRDQNTEPDKKLAELERVNAQLPGVLEEGLYPEHPKVLAAIAAAKGEA